MANLQECVKRLVEQSKGLLSVDQAREIFENLEKGKDAAVARGMDADDHIMDRAKRIQDQVTRQAKIQQKNALTNARIYSEIHAKIRKFIDSGLSIEKAHQAFMVGAETNVNSGLLSVDKINKDIENRKLGGGLVSKLEKAGVYDTWKDKANSLPIAKEVWNLYEGKGKDIGNTAEVKTVAKIIYDMQEYARMRQNRAGSDIGKLSDYLVANAHDQWKIRNAVDSINRTNIFARNNPLRKVTDRENYKAWRDYTLKYLNHEKTFADVDNKEEFMRSVYDALVSGQHLKPASESDGLFGFNGPSNLAKKVSKSRLLHWQDAESWDKYNSIFGTGPDGFHEAVVKGLMKSGKDIGMLENLGTNPKAMWDKVVRDNGEQYRDLWNLKKAKGIVNIPFEAYEAEVLRQAGIKPVDDQGNYRYTDIKKLANEKTLREFNIANPKEEAYNGKVKLDGDYKALVAAASSPDKLNLIKEGSHVYTDMLHQLSKKIDLPDELKERWKTISDHLGLNEKGKLSKESHEKFAQDFHNYLTKEGPYQPEMKGMFDHYKQWLNEVYKKIAKFNDIPKDTKALFKDIAKSDIKIKDKNINKLLDETTDRIAAAGEKHGRMGWEESMIAASGFKALYKAIIHGAGDNIDGLNDIKKFMDDLNIEKPKEANPLDKVPDSALDKSYQSQIDATSNRERRGNSLDRILQNQYDNVSGDVNIPDNIKMAHIGGALRGWQMITKMGSAMLSCLSHIPNVGAELRYQGDSFLSGQAKIFHAAFLDKPSEFKKQTGHLLGQGLDAVIGDVANYFSSVDSGPGTMSKASRTMFKLNGMNWLLDRLKTGVVTIMSGRLAQIKDVEFGKLDKAQQNVFGHYGIDAPHWDVIRAVEGRMDENGRGPFVTPEQVQDLPENVITDAMKLRDGGGAKLYSAAEIDKFKNEVESKLGVYFIDRADHAVFAHGAREGAILNQGLQRGTVEGEAIRMIAQFKGFPATFLTKAWGRELYGRGHADMPAFLSLVAATTLMGYVSMSAKDISKGKVPRDPLDPKTFIASMVQGGGLGIFGDYVFGDFDRFGGSPIETTAGPVAGQISDVMRTLAQIRDGQDPRASALKTAINNLPFANLFYLREPLNRLMLYQMQENMNPGYLRRMEARVKQQNNQDFLFKPSDPDNRL